MNESLVTERGLQEETIWFMSTSSFKAYYFRPEIVQNISPHSFSSSVSKAFSTDYLVRPSACPFFTTVSKYQCLPRAHFCYYFFNLWLTNWQPHKRDPRDVTLSRIYGMLRLYRSIGLPQSTCFSIAREIELYLFRTQQKKSEYYHSFLLSHHPPPTPTPTPTSLSFR